MFLSHNNHFFALKLLCLYIRQHFAFLSILYNYSLGLFISHQLSIHEVSSKYLILRHLLAHISSDCISPTATYYGLTPLRRPRKFLKMKMSYSDNKL
jgi:hypothetical protein